MPYRSEIMMSFPELDTGPTDEIGHAVNDTNYCLRETTNKFRRELPEPDLCAGLIQSIPGTIENQLLKLLAPKERVLVQIKGSIKEVLICTNLRVLIIRASVVAEQDFERSAFQATYSEITSAKVEFGISSGYFEVSRERNPALVFGHFDDNSSASCIDVPNSILIRDRMTANLFRCVGAFIMATGALLT